MKNLDHNSSVDNNILEGVGVPADSTAQSELLPRSRVFHMQGTLVNIQRYGLNTIMRCEQLSVDPGILPWEPRGTEAAQVWECWRLAGSHRDRRYRSGWCRSRRRLRQSSSICTCTLQTQTHGVDTPKTRN